MHVFRQPRMNRIDCYPQLYLISIIHYQHMWLKVYIVYISWSLRLIILNCISMLSPLYPCYTPEISTNHIFTPPRFLPSFFGRDLQREALHLGKMPDDVPALLSLAIGEKVGKWGLNPQETMVFTMKYGDSCKFSLQHIHWICEIYKMWFKDFIRSVLAPGGMGTRSIAPNRSLKLYQYPSNSKRTVPDFRDPFGWKIPSGKLWKITIFNG